MALLVIAPMPAAAAAGEGLAGKAEVLAAELRLKAEQAIILGAAFLDRNRHTVSGALVGCAAGSLLGASTALAAGAATGGAALLGTGQAAILGCGLGGLAGAALGRPLERVFAE